MGLSIYYRLKIKTDANSARALINTLYELVKTLPFDRVSQILEYDPPDGLYVFERADDEAGANRWKPGTAYLTRKRSDGKEEMVRAPAMHVICFHANLAGSETASFGLAAHPAVVLHHEDMILPTDGGGEQRQLGAGAAIEYATRLGGWYSWSHGTKTQYAANPRYGGVENFLRAHLSIFRAVDEARRLGLKTRIRDDGGYWRHRDQEKLLAELARWDELIAGFAGRLSDQLQAVPGALVAPIKDRPDYEHLEARGDAKLRELHRRDDADAGKRTRRRGRDSPKE